MKRGWKLDPQWVAHYEKRDHDRAQRQIDRIRSEYEMQVWNAKIEQTMRDLRKPLPIKFV